MARKGSSVVDKSFPKALSLALTAIVVVAIVLLALDRQFFVEAMLSAFFASALAGALILHLAVAPKRDALFVIACAAVLGSIEFGVLHFSHGATIVVPLISLLGLSSLLVFGVRTAWSRGEQRGFYLRAFLPAVLFVVSEYSASTLLQVGVSLHPKTLDLYLYLFDASLGSELSFAAGRLLRQVPWLQVITLIVYMGLAVPIALVAAGLVRARNNRAIPAILAFLLTGPAGILFYNILPACGPRYVFGAGFPFMPLSALQLAHLVVAPIPVAGPRNAIPSLHMAWVLLAWWNSKGLAAWIRAVVLFFLVFTVLGTLGIGEHYFIDLIVAFPFAVAVQAACDYRWPVRDARRSRPLLAGLLMTLAWMAALSFAPQRLWLASPVIGWTLIGMTVFASLYLQRVSTAESYREQTRAERKRVAVAAAV